MVLHVLAAVAWVGGSIFMTTVLAPVLRTTELRPHAALVIRGSGRRFRTLTHAAFSVFLVTGAILLAHRGFVLDPLLVVKLVLVGGAFAISLMHAFGAGRRRQVATWLGRLNLALMTAIVLLSILVARGG